MVGSRTLARLASWPRRCPLKMPLDHGPTVGCGYYCVFPVIFVTLHSIRGQEMERVSKDGMVPVGGAGRPPLKESIPCPLGRETPLSFPIQSSQFHCSSCSCTGRVSGGGCAASRKWRTMPSEPSSCPTCDTFDACAVGRISFPPVSFPFPSSLRFGPKHSSAQHTGFFFLTDSFGGFGFYRPSRHCIHPTRKCGATLASDTIRFRFF